MHDQLFCSNDCLRTRRVEAMSDGAAGDGETQVRGWVDGVGNEVVLFGSVLSVVVILLIGCLLSDGRRLNCICTF